MSLECHEDCSIAYHQSCWRKYKNDCEQKTDKDFLLTPCATPDCSGFVKLIIIFDNKGKHKARVRDRDNVRKRVRERERKFVLNYCFGP